MISILINNYNYGRYLPQAIQSCLDQKDAPPYEIIVVDDGSTDNSAEIIKGFVSSFKPVVKPVFKNNGGQASAINAGLAIAQYNLITLLDSDDYLLPEALATICTNYHDGVSRIHYRMIRIDNFGKQLGYEPPADFQLSQGKLDRAALKDIPIVQPPTSGITFNRAVIEKFLPIPEEYFLNCCDSYISVCTALTGDVVAIEECIACYRLHGANHSGNDSGRFPTSGKSCLDRALANIGRFNLLTRYAEINNKQVSCQPSNVVGSLRFRLAARRRFGPHPLLAQDTIPYLLKLAVKTLWKSKSISLQYRLYYTGWFFLYSVLPVTALDWSTEIINMVKQNHLS